MASGLESEFATLHEIVTNDPQQQGHLDIHLSQGLQAFSFTYG